MRPGSPDRSGIRLKIPEPAARSGRPDVVFVDRDQGAVIFYSEPFYCTMSEQHGGDHEHGAAERNGHMEGTGGRSGLALF